MQRTLRLVGHAVCPPALPFLSSLLGGIHGPRLHLGLLIFIRLVTARLGISKGRLLFRGVFDAPIGPSPSCGCQAAME